ncbi:MAG TPA: DUF1571 domain-containing protein, partial [Gemmataceae bacterium]|nr:DUF1571 domain-containing protein [Gemmataceae bacterium]
MRTLLYRPVTFGGLLVLCLAFAPARRVTGDRELVGHPSALPPAASAGPAARSFAELCRDDPVEAIARSMRKYKAEVEGYSCILVKRERINGELRDPEVIACDFQEAPFAVIMRWVEGKARAEAMLYAAGQNGDQLLIVPASDLGKSALKLIGRTYAKRALTSEDAKSASRYPANQFGIYCGTARVYDAWKAAHERGALRTEYEGVRPIPEMNGRPCHVLRRNCLVPEEDGLTQVTILFDAETHFQVGAVLMAGAELIGRYYFRDLRLNPKFDALHFSAE